MIRLKLEVDASGLNKATASFARAARDYRPVWSRVAGVIYEDMRGRFETEGAGTWAHLAPAYRSWKLRHYPSQSIGQLTGSLMRSVTSQNAPGSIYEEGRLTLTLGSSVKHGAWFSHGTRRQPARPVYAITSAAERAVNEQIFEYLSGEAQDAGFEVKRS